MRSLLYVSVICLGMMPAQGAREHRDARAIRAQIERFVAAFNAHDADEAARVYTDPHVDVNAPRPVESRAMTKERFQRTFDRFNVELRVTSDEIVVNGDWAFQRGELYETLTPKNRGETHSVTLRYVEVLERQADGSWLVYWGMDGPLAEADAP